MYIYMYIYIEHSYNSNWKSNHPQFLTRLASQASPRYAVYGKFARRSSLLRQAAGYPFQLVMTNDDY